MLASGPGQLVEWESTLSTAQQKGLAESNAKVEATLAKLRAKGHKIDLGAKIDPATFRRTAQKGRA